MATASASAASAPVIFAPGSRRPIIAWTCCFSALPVPTIDFFTILAEYSPTSVPVRARATSAAPRAWPSFKVDCGFLSRRSEEHTSELQSLMRISYAVFCLKKKTTIMRTYTCTATDQCLDDHYNNIYISTHTA